MEGHQLCGGAPAVYGEAPTLANVAHNMVRIVDNKKTLGGMKSLYTPFITCVS